MIKEIADDFDMTKIMTSGQCFRVKEVSDGIFRFITGSHVVYIRGPVSTETGCRLTVSCTEDDWRDVWERYFDLDRSYSDVVAREYGKHPFADDAILFGRGLRILRQDSWEMLITFIISQRKSIPAIGSAVASLCTKFGDVISPDRDRILSELDVTDEAERKALLDDMDALHAFPKPEQLLLASDVELKECSLGYRAPYVRDAAKKVCSGEFDPGKAAELDDDALFDKLKGIYGVGSKVANCVMLFGYSRTGRVPVDVWIKRAIEEDCGGYDPFPLYGENGGIIQQYIFFYQKNKPI